MAVMNGLNMTAGSKPIIYRYGKDTADDLSFERKPGADTWITYDGIKLSIIDNATVFHFGTFSLTNDSVRETTISISLC